MSITETIITVGFLLASASWLNGQALPPLGPVSLDVDWGEIYGAVELSDATSILDIPGMFEFPEAEVPTPKLNEFVKKEEKRRERSIRETAGWLMDFALSGRLSAYMDKAHNMYIILSDDEKKMHKKFFESYVLVSPEVIGGTEVAKIISTAQTILDKINAIKQLLITNKDLLSDDEFTALIQLLNKALKLKQQHLFEFENLTTDNVLVATHGERMNLLSMLKEASINIDKGLDSLYAQVVTLLMSRSEQQITHETLNMMFDLD